MSEKPQSTHPVIEAVETAKQPFDWETIKIQLLEKLRTTNDPRSFLEYLLEFPEEHMETEFWDDYLVWIYDHTDEVLDLAKRGIPDIADEVIMVLADTHAFIEERAGGFEEYGYEEKGDALREKLLSFCKENLSLFWVDDKSEPYRFGLRLPALSKIIWLCGDESEARPMLLRYMAHQAAVETLKRGFTEEDFKEDKPLAYTDLLFDIENAVQDMLLDEEIEEVAEAVSSRTRAQFDLRRQRLHDASRSEKARAHHKHLREWVASALSLEGHARGAPKELQERFGIINFNHYPLEVLKQQYDLRDAEVPYGILVGTQYDWNDALTNHYSNEQMLKDFHQQVSEHGSNIRIIEVDSPRSLARQLLKLEREYGDVHKITFALVRAHGGEEEVQLGNIYGQTLSKKRLGRVDPENLKRFFVEHPNIVFDSCSVGAYDGLAEAVASVLDGTAQGPEDISHGIEKIEVSGEREHLTFSVTLRDGGKMNVHSK